MNDLVYCRVSKDTIFLCEGAKWVDIAVEFSRVRSKAISSYIFSKIPLPVIDLSRNTSFPDNLVCILSIPQGPINTMKEVAKVSHGSSPNRSAFDPGLQLDPARHGTCLQAR